MPGSAAEAAPGAGPASTSRSTVERLGRALPWVGLGLAALIFYWVEAWKRKTPWLFTDELEWTQISRGIAATGHAARRGQPIGFRSLYGYLIAPAWWLHSTATSYAAIKYLNALVMCLTAVPTFLLARLLVARRVAVAVALLSISIPAMAYATSIIPEALAYFWFSLAAWLIVRALAAPRPGAVALAAAVAAAGPLVRQEFLALPASFVLAAAGLWVLRQRAATGLRIPWKRGLAAAVALTIFGYLFNRYVIAHYQSSHPSQYLNGHTLRAGGLAAGALAIGLGVLPVIGGLTSLWLPERRREPAYRAFASYLAASVLTIWLYTAAKATILFPSFGSLIEERNLFYLSPLLLLGTALALGARRLDWRVVAAATALVLVLVWSSLFEVGAPYFEAPGLAILTLVNRDPLRWDVNDFHRLLVAAALVSLALLALRSRRGVPVVAAVLVGAWLLTGQIYATKANTDYASTVAKRISSPRSWVDDYTHGQPTTFLGQGILDPNTIWLTEFWNRSLHHVASLDGTAPGPGPTFVPGLLTVDGALNESTGDPFTLTSGGVVLAAPVVHRQDGFTLYRTLGPWRLLETEQNVYSDGWATSPVTYAYYAKGGPGVLTVDLSRTAYNGDAPPGRATIRVGKIRIENQSGAMLGRVVAVRRAVIRNGGEVTVRIHVAETPVIVSITVVPTFSTPSDSRQLAAQVGFGFVRDR